MLECIGLCDRRAKEFKVSNFFVNTFCSALDPEVRGLKQGCQTRGPWAACGPQSLSMRPARRF